jgi:hypothetical protein
MINLKIVFLLQKNMIYQDLKKTLDDNVDRFLDILADGYNIPKSDLSKKWVDFNLPEALPEPLPTPTSVLQVEEKKVKAKKTPYQNYFTKRRTELKTSNSALSFGEISKTISGEWSSFMQSEKNKYLDDSFSAAPPPPPSLPTPHSFTFDELNAKKMDELKELCEKRGTKKSGNKTQLIKNLMELNTLVQKAEILPPQKTTLAKLKECDRNDKNDNSLDLYVSSNQEKRSDFETVTMEIPPEEEDGFEFDDIEKFESESEDSLEDEDEDENIQDDDENPFED